MIELTRTQETHFEWKVKVLGIGSAGSNAVDRLNREGLAGVEFLVTNTDARALGAALTQERFILGQSLTRGMGAGGDPELGRAAVLESGAQLGARLAGASLVVLLVGLGGGTGSGAAPLIAQMARDQGSHVAVFATLPFGFEGRRRREQALSALDQLQEQADLVVCFENDRMPALSDPASGIEDAFQAVDSMLAQSVRAVCAMTRRRSVLHSGLDEIAAVVKGGRATALFGFGAADGEERARAAVARAFANPLLDAGGAFSALERLWVYVAGGSDMRLVELQAVMEAVLDRVGQGVRLFLGTAVDSQMSGAVSVTLIAGLPAQGEPGGLAGGAGGLGEGAPGVQPVASSSYAPSVASVFHSASRSSHVPVAEYHEYEDRSAQVGYSPESVPDVQSAPVAYAPPSNRDHPEAAEVHEFREPEVFEESIPGAEGFSERYATLSPIYETGVQGDTAHFSGGAPVREYDADEARSDTPYASETASPGAYQKDPWEPEPSVHAANRPPAAASTSRSLPVPPYELAQERRREEGSGGWGRGAESGEGASGREDTREEVVREEVREPARHRAEVDTRSFAQQPDETGGGAGPALHLATGSPGAAESNVRRTKETVQEQLSFEPVSRGRFEKTDRTIVDGVDLDVPTFMRQGVPLE